MSNFEFNLPGNWKKIPADSLLLTNVQIVDPYRSDETVKSSVYIEQGKIVAIGTDADARTAEHTIDLQGKYLSPGWFDLHVHLREPGFEHKEDIETGLNAAMVGGFTGVACMPNTDPALDNAGIVKWLLDKAAEHPVFLSVVAAATKGRKGKELTELVELAQVGVKAVSDDGSPVVNSGVVRRIMEYGAGCGIKFFSHAEDQTLIDKGVMNEGVWSTTLGMSGMPTVAEDVMVARDLLLAEYVNSPVHICHLSSKRSVELLREARSRGVKATAEATPHHFALSLTDAAVESFSTDLKMNPPLRSEQDVLAIHEGLRDGTITCIATDHAPHAPEEKEVEFDYAPFGILGLETCFAVAVTELVDTGVITLSQVIEKLTKGPREVLDLPSNSIQVGNVADLTIFDPGLSWTVDKFAVQSRSRNTPFHGKTLTGKPLGIVSKGALYLSIA